MMAEGTIRLENSSVSTKNLAIQKNIAPTKVKERNVLFKDALNTFYFTDIWRRTYGKRPLI